MDALPPGPALRMLTYNLWFSEHSGLEVVREKRMRAINSIIEDACPDVIFFQACLAEHLCALRHCKMATDGYCVPCIA